MVRNPTQVNLINLPSFTTFSKRGEVAKLAPGLEFERGRSPERGGPPPPPPSKFPGARGPGTPSTLTTPFPTDLL